MVKAPLGIAIGPDRITALVGEGGAFREVSVPLVLPAGSEDPTPALALALDGLRELGFGEEGGEVTVALLPPLVEVKLVPLPPLRPEEAEAVLRRDLAKHFLRGGTASVVGVDMHRGMDMHRGGVRSSEGSGMGVGSEVVGASDGEVQRAGRGPVLAAAAPRQLAEAILRSVAGAGWRLAAIVPAHAAWVEAVRSGGEGKAPARGAPGLVVAIHGETAHLLRLDEDRPTGMRRLPATNIPEIVAAAGGGAGRAWVFASDAEGRPIAEALAAAGWQSGVEARLRRSAAGVAALHAHEAGAELVPPTLAMARRDRARRVAVGMGIAAAVLVVAAAGVQLWGASRELRLVRAERAEIREAVAPVLAAADSLGMIEERLASIGTLEEAASGWTFALVELAVVLPEDVHLAALQAAGDTLVMDAVGGRAGDALDALGNSSSFRDVQLEGTIQRDVEAGAAARERFTLSAIRADGLPSAAKTGERPSELERVAEPDRPRPDSEERDP
ncbi:MAG: PilN domain-containing protein [Gemmatimonadota bacterium]